MCTGQTLGACVRECVGAEIGEAGEGGEEVLVEMQ